MHWRFAFCCGPCYSYTAAQAAGEDSSMSIIVCLAPYLTGIPAIGNADHYTLFIFIIKLKINESLKNLGLCCLRENIRKRRGIQVNYIIIWYNLIVSEG